MRISALLTIILLTGSVWAADLPKKCALSNTDRIMDKLETFVISGVGTPPICRPGEFCCVVKAFGEVNVARRNQTIPVWARAVYFDRLNAGIGGKAINISVVDSNGREIPSGSGEYTVTPTFSDSLGDGFLQDATTITFLDSARTAQLYLLKFSYADKGSLSFSYGPYFYVTDGTITQRDRDILYLSGHTLKQD